MATIEMCRPQFREVRLLILCLLIHLFRLLHDNILYSVAELQPPTSISNSAER
jgi:hypothetical protein